MTIVNELIYRCYRFNREREPGVTPEQWGDIFDNVEALEARLQRELEHEEEHRNETIQTDR